MIDKKTLEIVKNKLIQVYNPLIIYIFGSYAWGNPEEDSDLDIVVIVDKSNEIIYKRPVKGHKALFDLNISKDILVYTKVEFEKRAEHVSALCYNIKNQGIKLYEAA
ncbi:MAG: nucleotidyltransferase domain-containing protein [Spirochaetes bacterium]|nr:nucleotidyltransferase domain-containing protein [Spirochaetota bacterium]